MPLPFAKTGTPQINDDRLADFTTDKRVLMLSGMALVIGTISAGVAWCLVWLISAITNLAFYQRLSAAPVSPENHALGYWVVLIPAAGGLIIGIMARYGSEKIRGHGIPEALEAILIGQSRMQPKIAALKPISSAISIGTGGPFGAEGPIIMTGGACGSLFAQMFHLSSAERKTLLVAGAAGGMSAIFATPVAAVLLAVELLLFEWKPRSFIPVALASIVASAWRVPLMGVAPIFPVIPHPVLGATELAIAFAVGISAGLASSLLTTLVYKFEDLFHKLPFHWMWWPLLGGLLVGVCGFLDPRVFGVGYDVIHSLLRGEGRGTGLLGLTILKALAWSVALGSGTSGGVLAPLLMMGGSLGVLESRWIPMGDPALWGMIGMGAMMGGTMRSPFTATLFILELTHDLNALPALLAGCVASQAVTVLMLRRSILTEKVARRGYHIIREYSVDPLHTLRVEEVMDKQVATLPVGMRVQELSQRIARGEPAFVRHHAMPIVDDAGILVGIITRGDLLRTLERNGQENPIVLDAGTKRLIVTYPDELMSEAADKMLRNHIGRLPVVSREDPRKLIGYIGRIAVLEARLQTHHEENVRETGWHSVPHRGFLQR